MFWLWKIIGRWRGEGTKSIRWLTECFISLGSQQSNMKRKQHEAFVQKGTTMLSTVTQYKQLGTRQWKNYCHNCNLKNTYQKSVLEKRQCEIGTHENPGVKIKECEVSALQQQWKMAPQDVNAIAQKIRQYCNAVLETRPIFSDQDQIYKTKIKTKTETARPRPRPRPKLQDQDQDRNCKTKTRPQLQSQDQDQDRCIRTSIRINLSK